MKECFKCHEVKPLSEFYKHKQMADGHVNKCKECNKKDVRKNRTDKVEYYRGYDKKRYIEDPKVKAIISKYTAFYVENNPVKEVAHRMVGDAVRDGRLEKLNYCTECGATGVTIHGHHDDYAFPLVVRWLCVPCHRKWHDENGEGANADR